jgi:amidase
MSSDRLPIGMMFTGRFADEATLFRLSGQLEKEQPWKDRRPPVWN